MTTFHHGVDIDEKRMEYARLCGMDTIALIDEIAVLGNGDTYYGDFSNEGAAVLRFAKRVLRERIRRLEKAAQEATR